jgi:hypothetical protein
MINVCRLFLLLLLLCTQAHAAAFNKIYVDKAKNVHLVLADGRDKKVTRGGRHYMALLSPDGETAAWLKESSWVVNGKKESGSDELVVYRKGTQRSIKCDPSIRSYWFAMGGRNIALDCGGSHLAGEEILYDATSLQEIERFDQYALPTDKRPKWSASSDQFDPN